MESAALREETQKAEAMLGGNGHRFLEHRAAHPQMVDAGSEQTARETAELLAHAVETLQKRDGI